VVLKSASVRVELTGLSFIKNRDNPRIRSTVCFITCASHFRENIGRAQEYMCKDLIH